MKRSTKNTYIAGIFTISAAILSGLLAMYANNEKDTDQNKRVIIGENKGKYKFRKHFNRNER